MDFETPSPLQLARRDFLRVGVLGVGGLTLPRAFELLESIPTAARRPARSAILIWLDGGASHIDTFDPKPQAPEEIWNRAWGTTPTSIPGVSLGKGLERTAKILHRCALVRSLTSDAGEHEIARHLLLTGYPSSPALEYPSQGSVVSCLAGEAPFPPYLALSTVREHERQLGPGFLAQEYAPFLIEENPTTRQFAVRDLDPPPGLSRARIESRRALLDRLDGFRRSDVSSSAVRSRRAAFDRAYALLASDAARSAFDVMKEPASVRAEYGDHALGRSCLLARRFVEAGARFVTVMDAGWDTHVRNFEQLRLHRLPKLDQALPALLADLERRGLLESTFVVVMGDFGRTPKINAVDGRDHWPRANCVLLAGAGVKQGVVHGATDERAEQVVDSPVSPSDLAATLYTLLGIDPRGEIETSDGRPVRLVDKGAPVSALLA